ncbi:V-type proton ATPase subunit H-like isoform X2 [Clavelina lepadiformis]|uniref:V-type proton ATPase subunit H-like isoform X2 n=1 Tax=Clavelina lepadiformis TaxID=159417 RepID=UPI004041D6B4
MSQVRNMSLGSDEIDENLIALAPVPTNKLQAQAIEVRAHRVNWQSYLQGQMIQAQDFEVIREFDLAKTPEARKEILDRRGDECARTFISLMTRISKEQTVRYVLTAVDDLLTEDRQRTQLFCDSNNKKRLSPWVGFMNMLNRTDRFIVHQASRIISKLACWSKERMSSHDLTYYLNWIKTQLSNENVNMPRETMALMASEVTDFVQSILSCLQMMLRVKEYREAFFNMDGMTSLQSLLYTKCGFQLQYQTIFCIWLITFSPELCDRMVQYNSVPVLADILAEAAKEKVTRIILGTFRNLIDKPVENDTVKVFSQAMIHFKVLKQLEILEGKQFADEDITNDVEFLTEHLSNCLQDLSSFDEYVSEVKSRRLEWSPVHKSEKFWRENAARLNEKNYELLKILTSLMETSQDPDILAVATHDIGEYVRHYPRGKKVIDQLGLKQLVMQLLAHENAQVKYCALIAVQKLMVHNWEYLGKQLTSG